MKYLIFDIDGTLTDTTSVDDECFINAFESLFALSIKNVQWDQMTNVTDWGITEELVWSKLNRQVQPVEIQKLKVLFLKQLQCHHADDQSKFKEIQGAATFYTSVLNDPSFKIGIATGGWEETANFKLNSIGIDPSQANYANSNHFKSREEITLEVIRQLDAGGEQKPDEIIYFGDGAWDYSTCSKLNIRFIGIDNIGNGKLKRIGAKEVYRNFLEPEIIMKSILG